MNRLTGKPSPLFNASIMPLLNTGSRKAERITHEQQPG
jgi:hypothetical protein